MWRLNNIKLRTRIRLQVGCVRIHILYNCCVSLNRQKEQIHVFNEKTRTDLYPILVRTHVFEKSVLSKISIQGVKL